MNINEAIIILKKKMDKCRIKILESDEPCLCSVCNYHTTSREEREAIETVMHILYAIKAIDGIDTTS